MEDMTGSEVVPLSETASPSIADGERRKLDPRSVNLGRFVGRIVTACIAVSAGVAAFVLWTVASPPTWVELIILLSWLAIVGLNGCWLHVWPALSYRYASYTVNSEGIEVRRGVLWRKEISVPRSRVQHTDVRQGPVERRYGLGTLDIYTAGTDHAKVEVPGLEHGQALLIRNHLLPLEETDAV